MFEGCGVPQEQITLRPATTRDVADIALLHIAAINEGFLSTLGTRFLRRLYARIIESPDGFLLVAHQGTGLSPAEDRATGQFGPVVGFVAGATSVRRLYRRFLWRDGVAAAVTSAPHLVRSAPRVLETIRYGAGDPGTALGESAAARESELLAMAVAEGSRRQGAGGALVNGFMSTAKELGSTSARVVVGATNHGAIALYGGAGFVDARRLELHAGTESLLLRADLTMTRVSDS
jgi:ribosomal protein S18 acetylase RimI-like enzyme